MSEQPEYGSAAFGYWRRTAGMRKAAEDAESIAEQARQKVRQAGAFATDVERRFAQQATAKAEEKRAYVETSDAAFERRQAEQAAQKAERQARHDQEIDARLEPRRLSERRRWLIANPALGEHTFDSRIWPLLKEEILETEESRESKIAAIVAQGNVRVTAAEPPAELPRAELPVDERPREERIAEIVKAAPVDDSGQG